MNTLTVKRTELLSALDIASAVVPSTTTKDILKSVVLRCWGTSVTIVASDSETGVVTTIPAECSGKFESLIGFAKFRQIVGAGNDESVKLEIDKGKVIIHCGGRFTLQCGDAAEFPPVGEFVAGDHWTVNLLAFQRAIDAALPATDVTSTRYALGGVLVDVAGGAVAATDSRRLFCGAVAFAKKGSPEAGNKPVIPQRAAKSIGRLEGVTADVAVTHNSISVRCGETTIHSRLIEGRFPDYKRVIPATRNTLVTLVVGPAVAAIQRSMLVTSEETRGVEFTFADGSMRLESQTADIGSALCEVPVAIEGDAVSVTFDPRYMLDFLNKIPKEESVELHLTDKDSAAKFVRGDWVCVVMPLARE